MSTEIITVKRKLENKKKMKSNERQKDLILTRYIKLQQARHAARMNTIESQKNLKQKIGAKYLWSGNNGWME